MDLKLYQVDKAPPVVFYIPEFITVEEELHLINSVNSAPKPKWTQLAHRRLQNWGGIPHPKGMIAEKLPSWLLKYTEKIGSMDIFGSEKLPNHVLVNEYLPGQGIMPHLDGPLFYPTVTTISCGSHTMLEFSLAHQPDETATLADSNPATCTKLLSLLLERRSLLVLQDTMYHKHLHSIAEVTHDTVTDSVANLEQCIGEYSVGQVLERGTRISLTIRHVPKTSKLQLRLGR